MTIYEMLHLDKRYADIQKEKGLDNGNHLKLFLVRLCHSLLPTLLRSVDAFRTAHLNVLYGLSQPNANITPSFLQIVTETSNLGEQRHYEITNLTSVIEALLDVLSPRLKNSDQFQRLDLDLRGIGRDLCLTTSTFAPRLDNRLKFLEMSRNIRESSSLWLLSLLAGIFLPLSLASSLLSMQSRLADLRYLLYDFCGVIVFFGTLAVASVQIIRQFAKRKGNIHNVFHVRDWVHWVLIVPEWMLIFSSFLVGMIKDVSLGLKVLGYGTAAVVNVYLLTNAGRFVYGRDQIIHIRNAIRELIRTKLTRPPWER
jgi:hypothetical protein